MGGELPEGSGVLSQVQVRSHDTIPFLYTVSETIPPLVNNEEETNLSAIVDNYVLCHDWIFQMVLTGMTYLKFHTSFDLIGPFHATRVFQIFSGVIERDLQHEMGCSVNNHSKWNKWQAVYFEWIVFVVWLIDEMRLAIFPAGAIVRDLHHHESLTRREQDLNQRRTWKQALMNEVLH